MEIPVLSADILLTVGKEHGIGLLRHNIFSSLANNVWDYGNLFLGDWA